MKKKFILMKFQDRHRISMWNSFTLKTLHIEESKLGWVYLGAEAHHWEGFQQILFSRPALYENKNIYTSI